MRRLLLLSVFSIYCLTISAQTKTWIGPAGGNFNVAANWNPGGVPNSDHDVIIPAGSDVLVNASANIKSFNLQGNALMTITNHFTTSNASSISSNAIIIWKEGNLSGAGTITNNGTINLITSVTKAMGNSLTLINNGILNINNSGDFVLGYGSPTLNNANAGTINLNTAGQITYTQGVGWLINSGVIRKTQDSGVYEILANFTNNDGTISVEKGTLKLNNSNTSLNDGTYNVTTGNTLEWASTIKLSGTLTGQVDGQINWIGTLNVEPSNEAIFDFSGPSGVTWSGGSFGGNGTLTNKGILNLTSDNVKNVGGTSTLNNTGTINFNSEGDLVLGYGSPTLNNSNSGVINLNSAGKITYTQGVGLLFNSGLIRKSQNNGLFVLFTKFTNNDGTILVENGTLKIDSSPVLLNDGIYNVTAGNTLEWASTVKPLGTLTGLLDGQIHWTGTLTVEEGTEAILNFTGPSGINWSKGGFNGNGTLTNKGIINLVGSDTKSVGGTSTLNNEGIFNINSDGDLVLGYGSPTLDNSTSGVINLNSAGKITYTQGAGLLFNSGLIRKSQNNGMFSLFAKFTNNDGTISVENGTLKIDSSPVLLNDGIYNVTAGNTLEWANTLKPSGTLTGLLDGQINWTGTLNVEAENEAILDFTGPSGINWSKGGFNGNGTLTNKGIINLIGSDTKSVGGTSTLNNEGTININSDGDLVLGYGSPKLKNSATGVINLNADGLFTYTQGVGQLENSGLVKKEGSNGNFAIDANTNNLSPGKIICETGVLSFGTYIGNGILGGNASVKLQNNTTFEGTIAPGSSPGTLTHVGNFKSSANTILASEINGPASGTQYDVFHVDGNAIVDGNVEVALSYAAGMNDQFVILTANNITSCNLPATVSAIYDSHNYTFDVVCNTDNVTLKVTDIVLGTEKNKLSNLSLYPNPSNGRFTLDLGKEYTEVTVQIINTLGRIVSSKKYASTRIIESEINDSVGIYFVRVSTAAGESTTLRILNQ